MFQECLLCLSHDRDVWQLAIVLSKKEEREKEKEKGNALPQDSRKNDKFPDLILRPFQEADIEKNQSGINNDVIGG